MARMLTITIAALLAVTAVSGQNATERLVPRCSEPMQSEAGIDQVLGWGANSNGQLGAQRNDPAVVRIPSLLFVSSSSAPAYSKVSLGLSHSAAVESNKLFSAGNGASGQLGGGVHTKMPAVREFRSWDALLETPASAPTPLGSRQVKDVSAGWHHTCAVMADSAGSISARLYCAGRNVEGQLGRNDIAVDMAFPTAVNGTQIFSAKNWANVACGADHTVAAATDGSLWAFGAGANGQLGNGGTALSRTPVQVQGFPIIGGVVADVQCGFRFCVVRMASGELWGWGENGAHQLGDSVAAPFVTAPVRIATGATQLAVGGAHVLAVINDQLYSWGSGTMGQTGQKKTIPDLMLEEWFVKAPRAVPDFEGVAIQSIAAGEKHSLIVTTCGEVYAMGSHAMGQTGLNTQGDVANKFRTYTPELIKTVAQRKVLPLKAIAGGFTSVVLGRQQ